MKKMSTKHKDASSDDEAPAAISFKQSKEQAVKRTTEIETATSKMFV